MWECVRLEGDLGESMCTLQYERERDNEGKKIVVRSVIDNKEVELNESYLLNTPFHILEKIMQLCVGVEYMHFRATCKCCNLATPLIYIMEQQNISIKEVFISFTVAYGDGQE
ncbi:hypothetical protein Tco_1143735 [Tanacetum coccineum]